LISDRWHRQLASSIFDEIKFEQRQQFAKQIARAGSCPETALLEQKLPLLKSVSVRKQLLTKEIAPAIFESGQELASSIFDEIKFEQRQQFAT
jgi:hypothetical protein